MKKGKIDNDLTIEEMIVEFPDIEDFFNELMKRQKKKVLKICDGKKEFKTKCFGEIKEYSFDIDLPKLNLCERHWIDLIMPKSNHKKEK